MPSLVYSLRVEAAQIVVVVVMGEEEEYFSKEITQVHHNNKLNNSLNITINNKSSSNISNHHHNLEAFAKRLLVDCEQHLAQGQGLHRLILAHYLRLCLLVLTTITI